jgi:hypothetical protein
MANELQVRYSDLINAKLRAELVLKDGVVFNNDYIGDPKAGAVKIPQRDGEVEVQDYSTTNGVAKTTQNTEYVTVVVNKDKAVNEVIDGYEAAAVPDDMVADRLDSAAYSLAYQLDSDGAAELIGGGTANNVASLTSATIYAEVVKIRTKMSKANIPNSGRYLLATPDTYALLLQSPEFISASNLGDAVKQTGAIGAIAGFTVYEWNDATPGLAFICGHPRYATRIKEWAVPVRVQDLAGSGDFIGASAVQGRYVYAHKVQRPAAIQCVYSPAGLTATLAASDAGKTIATVTGTPASGSLAYKINVGTRVVYGTTKTAYAGTNLTSGTTKIPVEVGDVIEIVGFDSSYNAANVTYVTVAASDIG